MTRRWKRAARFLLSSVAAARLRRKNDVEAGQALAVLVRHGRQLSSATERRARTEAVERFGDARHAHWLKVYAAVQSTYREGWLPQSYYTEVALPHVNGTSHHLGRTRSTNSIFFNREHLCDLLYSINGRFLTSRLDSVTPEDALGLLEDGGADVVFKADQSGFGTGVRSVQVAGLTASRLLALGDGVFQPLLRGHPAFDAFGGPALATLRIGTVLTSVGDPQVRCCYIKFGRQGQHHVIARDQIRVAVDWQSGALDSVGYLSDWQPLNAHPETNARFDGFVVPGAREAAEAAVALHRRIPLPRFVCWDFAIDPEVKVWLLEWEGGVVSFAEAVQGPCFADLGWQGASGLAVPT